MAFTIFFLSSAALGQAKSRQRHLCPVWQELRDTRSVIFRDNHNGPRIRVTLPPLQRVGRFRVSEARVGKHQKASGPVGSSTKRGRPVMSELTEEPEDTPAVRLGRQIKRIRLVAGYSTHLALARRIGFGEDVIQKAETGKRVPS